MAKDSIRKCSCCGNNGHNSRTCNGKGCLKLFGVTIVAAGGNGNNDEGSIRKSFSMGNLQVSAGDRNSGDSSGYVSDGPIHAENRKASNEKKKGIPWSKEEHQTFLSGLEKLGKGDWKGISKQYVTTRTPTQVASHAQKYFNRLTLSENKKKRASVFDVPLKENAPAPKAPPYSLTHKAPEVTPESSTSHNGLLKNTHETPQSSSSAQDVTLFQSPISSEAQSVHPMAANYGVPNSCGVPYMVGVPISSQNFPPPNIAAGAPCFPVMNFPNQGYVYMPRFQGNFSTCAPISSSQPAAVGGLFPQPFPIAFSWATSGSSPRG